MNADLLLTFLSDAYFFQEIGYIKATETKAYGRNTVSYAASVNKEVVIIPAKASELQNIGLGKFNDNQSYFVFTKENFSLNDVLVYNGGKYQRINSQDWNAYGFNKYVISVYNEDTLNDPEEPAQ